MGCAKFIVGLVVGAIGAVSLYVFGVFLFSRLMSGQ